MQLQTTSETISFIREYEHLIAGYYDELATRFPERADDFTALAADNRKYFVLLERAYFSVISDAIEGGYAFDMDPDAYQFDPALAADATLDQAVKQALALEQTSIEFYTLAAEQSAALMADVPQTMKQIVKKKLRRQDVIAEITG
jgi:hypothetical protein